MGTWVSGQSRTKAGDGLGRSQFVPERALLMFDGNLRHATCTCRRVIGVRREGRRRNGGP